MSIVTFALGICFAVALTSQLCFADAAKTQAVENAASASKAWLEYLDQGKYAEAWDHGSDLMKKSMPKDEWVKLQTITRKPLGSVKERKVLDERTAKDPHGLPKGDYMVMLYNTTFSNSAQKKELLTLYLGEGGWHVMTYQVE